MSKLDQSLDSIISSNKPQRGERRGGFRGGRGGRDRNDRDRGNRFNPYSRGAPNEARPAPARPDPAALVQLQALAALQAQAAQVQAQAQAAQAAPEKKVVGNTIHISNLDKEVTSEDLKDIFEKVGAVKHAQVNYNQNGQSLGTAEVKFHSNKDAEQAVAEYDGAEVDGKPMYLKLVGNVVTAPVVVKKGVQAPAAPLLPLAFPSALSAVAAAGLPGFPGARPPRADNRDFRPAQQGRDFRDSRDRRPAPTTRGGRGGSRGGRRPDQPRKPASADDLDAELEKYHSSKPADEKAAAPAESS